LAELFSLFSLISSITKHKNKEKEHLTQK